MRCVAISDLHGNLPIDLPEGNVLVIAGDIAPDYWKKSPTGYNWDSADHARQKNWLEKKFIPWTQEQFKIFDEIVFVAGNHDFVFELPWLLPDWQGVNYLQDSAVRIKGYNFWGTPWVPDLPDWAFYGDSHDLENKFAMIPEDTDILISHGPPRGYHDMVKYPHWHDCGSAELLDHIERVKPKVVFCGHIHEQRGKAKMPDQDTMIYNVSILDDRYELVFDAVIVDLEDK